MITLAYMHSGVSPPHTHTDTLYVLRASAHASRRPTIHVLHMFCSEREGEEEEEEKEKVEEDKVEEVEKEEEEEKKVGQGTRQRKRWRRRET